MFQDTNQTTHQTEEATDTIQGVPSNAPRRESGAAGIHTTRGVSEHAHLGLRSFSLLLHLVISPRPKVRCAAEKALSQFPSKAIGDVLALVLPESLDEAGHTLVHRLTQAGEAALTRENLRLLKDLLRRLNQRTLEALGAWKMQRDVPNTIDALADPSPTVRRLAATLLGSSEDPRAAPALCEVLCTDKSRPVQFAALGAIRRLGPCETIIPKLCDLLRTAPEHPTHGYLARLLASWHVFDAAPIILCFLREIPQHWTSMNPYLEALALLHVPEAIQPLLLLSQDDYAPDKAVEALCHYPDETLRPTMRAFLTHECNESQRHATRWLGQHGQREDCEAFCDNLQHWCERLRLASVEAIELRLQHAPAQTQPTLTLLESLCALLEDEPNLLVRMSTIRVLCRLGLEVGRQALRKALSQGPWREKVHGIEVIKTLLLFDEIDALRSCLCASHAEVRQHAARTLHHFAQCKELQRSYEDTLFQP